MKAADDVIVDKSLQTWVDYANYGFEFLEVIYAIIWVICGLFICFVLHIMKDENQTYKQFFKSMFQEIKITVIRTLRALPDMIKYFLFATNQE